MTTEVMKQALDALSDFLALIKYQYSGSREAMSDLQYADNRAVFAVTALRQAISEASIDTLSDLTPKREAFANAVASGMTQADAYRHASLDTSQSHACTWPTCTPREWTGLTEDEAHVCFKSANVWHAIEAKLKEKNHG